MDLIEKEPLVQHFTATRESEALLASLRSEFSTPIDAIIGYSEILLDEISTSELSKFTSYLTYIIESGEHLKKSVDEILDLANFSNKKNNFDLKQLSMDFHFSLFTELNSVIGYCDLILEDDIKIEDLKFAADIKRIRQAATLFISYIDEIDRLTKIQFQNADFVAHFNNASIIIREVLKSIPHLEETFMHKPPAHPGSVLVVEENPLARDLLMRRLIHYGYSVTACEKSAQVLDKIYIGNFDLVILEIAMSDIDGFEILKQIKEHPLYYYLPVIMLSPFKENSIMAICLEKGADDYLVRPLNPVIFKARIEACIEKKILEEKEQKYLHWLRSEKVKSENLLLNIVPSSIAECLKRGDEIVVERYASASVIVIDIDNFIELTESVSPEELLKILNTLFSKIDDLLANYHVQKIRTIGDRYMAISGASISNKHHAESLANLAIELMEEIQHLNKQWSYGIQLKISIHTGPVIEGAVSNSRNENLKFPEISAANERDNNTSDKLSKENIVSKSKLMYDLWGTTVTFVNRMQTKNQTGCILISETSYQILKDKFVLTQSGSTHLKEVGRIKTFFLKGLKKT